MKDIVVLYVQTNHHYKIIHEEWKEMNIFQEYSTESTTVLCMFRIENFLSLQQKMKRLSFLIILFKIHLH